jgi:hypothetical protein
VQQHVQAVLLRPVVGADGAPAHGSGRLHRARRDFFAREWR